MTFLKMKIKHWIMGLIGALVYGFASGIMLTIVDPQHFNLADGWETLKNAVMVSVMVSGAAYLQKSLVPPDDDVKPPIALLLALLLPFSFGCATAPSGNAVVAGYELTPETVQRDIRLAAKIGAREGCKQDRNVEPYLQSAVVVLTAALNDGAIDFETVKASLANISVKEIRSDTAQQYISDALELYQAHAGSQVAGKIDGVKYLRPALTGLRDGIVDGLAQYDATK